MKCIHDGLGILFTCIYSMGCNYTDISSAHSIILFSCGVSVFAGFMGLLKGVVHTPMIDDMRFVFFTYELTGLTALIVGLILTVVFFVLGVLCWKGTVGMVRFLQTQRWKLKYGGTELS